VLDKYTHPNIITTYIVRSYKTFLQQQRNEPGTCIQKEKHVQETKLDTLKWSRYRRGVAQRVGKSIALLFHDRGTRRGRVVSITLRPHFTPEKDPVPIVQEAGWAPGPVWTGGKSRPNRNSIPDRPARSQSLYRLSYRPTKFTYSVHKLQRRYCGRCAPVN